MPNSMTIAPNDPLKGRILRTSDGSSWYIEFDNLRTGETSSVYSNVIPRTNNLMVATTLEAAQHSYTANPLDNTDMPGATEFNSMAYKYTEIP